MTCVNWQKALDFVKQATNFSSISSKDIKCNKQPKWIYVQVNKTTNIHKVSPDDCNNPLNGNVTTVYKKAD